MQVILIKDVENLGYANDIVEVRPGYANNYLIPQGFAKSATASARKVLAENLKQQAHKEAKLVADAEALAARLAETVLKITAKAEEGRIFGSVTAANISDALKAAGYDVDKKKVVLSAPIKSMGVYDVDLKLLEGISAKIKVNVVEEK